MDTLAHIGIDLAWGTRNKTGLAAVDDSGALVGSATLRTDDEIVQWIEASGSRVGVVAIDAPLIVTNPDGKRACERAIDAVYARFQAGTHASNLRWPWFDPPRAQTLTRRMGLDIDPSKPVLEGVAIEVYPHAAMVGLFQLGRTLKYKRKKQGFDVQLAETRRLLGLMESIAPLRLGRSSDWRAIQTSVEGAATPAALGRVEDGIDGILCAHLAWMWAQRSEALQAYGDAEQGCIVAPPPPTWSPTPRVGPRRSQATSEPPREDADMTRRRSDPDTSS